MSQKRKTPDVLASDERSQSVKEEISSQKEQGVKPLQREDHGYTLSQLKAWWWSWLWQERKTHDVLASDKRKQSVNEEISSQKEHGFRPVQREDHGYRLSQLKGRWQERKTPDVLASDKRKQSVNEEISSQKEHGFKPVQREDHGYRLSQLKDHTSWRQKRKTPDVLASDERKQSVNEEISSQKEQGVKPFQREDHGYSLSQLKDMEDESEFLEAVRNSEGKVIEMIRNKQIPKLSIMKTAINQDGYSKGVQLALQEMSKLVKREISQAIDAWCGYAPEDPHSPVFVVTLKHQRCLQKKTEIKELFVGYTIIIRHRYVPNDEEKSIVDRCGYLRVRSEDVAHVNDCIAVHTERLMREHSKLSIIRPCSIKTCGYMRKNMKLIDGTCIVFSVPVKGIIPVGEKEFPSFIDGIVTDVREGEFLVFGAHNAMKYHKNLRMGCCITGDKIGSLAGFVDLPGGKVGCLTCAHVVLTNEQIEQYIQMGEEAKSLNDEFAKGSMQIDIHQPTPHPDLKPFGTVHAIALDAGNIFTPSVDAAIIQITDDERKPEAGSFPDGDFESIGFTKEDPMFYTSGDILQDIEPHQKGSLVIKFGCTTGITRGYMEWIGESVRQVDPWGNYCFPVMRGQWEVCVDKFAEPGDSGALVFLCSGGNIRNLKAVGMIMGGSSTGCSCFITPINAVFEKLGLINNKFKLLPPIKLPQQEETFQQITEHINAHDHAISEQKLTLDRLSEKVRTIENNMTQGLIKVEENMIGHLTRVENNMTESMKEHIAKVEHNMNENMKFHFNRIGDVLKELSDKS